MKKHWLMTVALLLAVSVAPAFAGDQVIFESKTVVPGQTAVPITISLENDLPINAITFPILVRTIAGEAFWANVPASIDTLPWYGRTINSCLSIRIMNLDPNYVDGVSPDKFMISAQRFFEPPIIAGPLEPIITIVFDVNSSIGQFVFDTTFYPPSNHLIYVEDIDYNSVDLDFTPGVITIPHGDAGIQIESKTVPTSSTGVEIGIRIANDDPLQKITLPLVCRNVSGGAFWTNVPAGPDTLPWEGRLTSALVHSRTLDKSQIDGISPDPFLIEASNDVDPALAPGPSEKMITLVFDVGDNAGKFEIDTALFAPAIGLEVETPGNPGVVITPEFIKGTITTVAPDTGNKVEVGSTSIQVKMPNVILPIKINTGVRARGISIPLVVRTVTGGAFWAANFDTVGWVMTPPGALSAPRKVLKQLNFDYVSPDNFVIWAKTIDDPCLDAGTHPAFLTIRFDVNNNPGDFELDTAFSPPGYTLYFTLCDEIGRALPAFTKGIVTLRPCDCSMNGDLNCDGELNPMDVVIMVNYVYRPPSAPFCNPGNCFQNGDINCDEEINPLDVVVLVNIIYRQFGSPCDPCTI